MLFTTTLLLHLLDLGLSFDFGLGMCWGCIGWNWEAFKIFLEVGNRSQLEAIMGFFGSKIGVDMGEILT
jgi:hypothetical protein